MEQLKVLKGAIMKCGVLSALGATGVLALIGCLSKQYSDQSFTSSGAKPSQESVQQVNTRPSPADHRRTVEFCSPLKLYQGETLTIALPVPHGSDLAVVGPDGTYFFLAFSQPDKGSPVQPVLHEKTFRNMTQVKLLTTEAKGVPWIEQNTLSGASEMIFTKTGRYRVLLSEALETEDPIIEASCEVDYLKAERAKH